MYALRVVVAMSETAGYDLRVHPRADAELDTFHPDVASDVKAKLDHAARTRQPSSLGCIKHLKGGDGLLSVHGDGVRVICELRTPIFAVLLAGKRRTVYDRLDVAGDRAEEVFADD